MLQERDLRGRDPARGHLVRGRYGHEYCVRRYFEPAWRALMGIHLGLSPCVARRKNSGSECLFQLPRSFLHQGASALTHTISQCPPCSALFARSLAPSFSFARGVRLFFLYHSSIRCSNERLNARVSTDIARVTGWCPSATAATIATAAAAAAAASETKRNYFTWLVDRPTWPRSCSRGILLLRRVRNAPLRETTPRNPFAFAPTCRMNH